MTDATTIAHPERLADLSLGPLLTIEAEQSLWDAWQLLFLSGRRHLVVVDDDGRCLGVVADRAILSELPLSEDHLNQRTVGQVMSNPTPLTLDDTPQEAARRMVDSAVDAIPILDSAQRLQGMVTSGDLSRWLAAH